MVRVLFVDDDADLRDAMVTTLRRKPYAVTAVDSAAAALEALAEQDFDIVISDEHMPGTLGTELLAKVAMEQPAVVRVLLTGCGELATAARAINEGRVFRFLQKPYRPADFFGLLEAAAAERKALLARHGPGVVPLDPLSRLAPDVRTQLSTREAEVVRLMASGYRTKQVAQRLFISTHTVRNHLRSVFQKLNVHSQQELLERLRPTGT